MPEPVIITLITTLGAILIALIGKVSWDVSKTRKDTAAVHESINNRDTPLSDRLEAVGDSATAANLAAVGLKTTVDELARKFEANHIEGMSAHATLARQVTEIGNAERNSRNRLDKHLEDTADLVRSIRNTD